MGKGNRLRGKKLWKKIQPEDDVNIVILTDPRKTDMIIPLMGPTGVGKSTFINSAAGQNVTIVGHDLKSCTAKIEAIAVPYPSSEDPTRRIVFVDTPGFDDTFIEDTEILRRIAVWLARSYDDGMKLAGIIYLHDISQTRMLGTTRKNLEMFRKLCGDDAIKNVILGTTKWGDVRKEVGYRREQQLAQEHWKHMLDKGAEMARFGDTHKSALTIVDLILKREVANALLIQHELVDLQQLLPETEAGKTLRYTLQELLQAQQDMSERLQRGEGGQEEQERYKETQNQIRSTLEQIRELKIPLSRRIMRFLTGH